MPIGSANQRFPTFSAITSTSRAASVYLVIDSAKARSVSPAHASARQQAKAAPVPLSSELVARGPQG